MSCRGQAERILKELVDSGRCQVAEIAGSLRRGLESSHDVDIVCADPSLEEMKGPIEHLQVEGCKIEIYRANPAHFGPMMLTYTGPKGANIGMRVAAGNKGMKLNQYGLFSGNRRIDDNTEDDICRKVLGRPCKPPHDR